MIILKENEIKLDTYLELRDSVKWKVLDREQARLALENALYTVCVYDDDKPIGMGNWLSKAKTFESKWIFCKS